MESTISEDGGIVKSEAGVTYLEPIMSGEELKAVDDGFQFALETEGMALDPILEKKLLRKIDFCILPLICALMSCQIMDKLTSSYAAIIGLRTDLGMTGNEYSWVGSSFYLGYTFFSYPANLLLQRYGVSRVLSTAVILWGVVICCHGACHSSVTFLLCRTILGMLESFMNPSYLILTGQWWKKEEQYLRCSIWYGFQAFGTILGSGLAYGFYTHLNSFSMTPWRLLYVVTGVITIFFGFISIIHIPDVPIKAWFLSETEKKYAVERVRENKTGFGNHQFKFYQFKEAMCDITTYLYFFFMFGREIQNGGYSAYGSILLKEEFKFDTGHALLMNMVGSAIDIIFPASFALLNVYLLPSRLMTCFLISAITFTGLCMLAFADSNVVRLVGFYLTYIDTAGTACIGSVVTSNVAGYTKKVTIQAVVFIGFAVGNIVGPQTYLSSEAPVYQTAKDASVGCYVMSTITPVLLMYIYWRRNKNKTEMPEEHNSKLAFGDLTDKENETFEYIL